MNQNLRSSRTILKVTVQYGMAPALAEHLDCTTPKDVLAILLQLPILAVDLLEKRDPLLYLLPLLPRCPDLLACPMDSFIMESETYILFFVTVCSEPPIQGTPGYNKALWWALPWRIQVKSCPLQRMPGYNEPFARVQKGLLCPGFTVSQRNMRENTTQWRTINRSMRHSQTSTVYIDTYEQSYFMIHLWFL